MEQGETTKATGEVTTSQMTTSQVTTSQMTTSQVTTQQVSKGKTQRQKCVSCCKKFLAFLFSTLGLCCLMISYTIFGGYIFMLLELENEENQRSSMNELRTEYVEIMRNLTWKMNVFHKENWTTVIDAVMLNYTRKVYHAIDEDGWDGKDSDEKYEPQWGFPGSMLYSITVVTTIGYGHIAPKTRLGRIVTIFYAIIGIPLTLLTITNLGGFMASAFRFLYKNICCGLCCLCCKKQRRRPSSVAYNDPENGMAKPLRDTNANDEVWGEGHRPGMSQQTSKTSASSFITWRQGLRRVLTTEDNKRVSVPIYISLLLIAGYILAGAMLFTFWETDWTFFIGCYFCFVTLTTIGFGDYVPGTSRDSWDSQEKLVLCALYLIFGLALIAMCFDLMQEEVKNKCKALGRMIFKDGEAEKQKKKKRGRRKRRKERNEKEKKQSKQIGEESAIDLDRVPSYDSFLKGRRGKSPLYTPPVVVFLPKYKENESQNGSSQLSMALNNDTDENKLDGNFEDYDESKRPIFLPKYPEGSLRGISPNRLASSDNEDPLQITIKRAYTNDDLHQQPNNKSDLAEQPL